MFFFLFTIVIIWTITVLSGYGISSFVGVVHIASSKAWVIFFPPPAMLSFPVIHFKDSSIILLNISQVSHSALRHLLESILYGHA